jgi:hypothetical protein
MGVTRHRNDTASPETIPPDPTFLKLPTIQLGHPWARHGNV